MKLRIGIQLFTQRNELSRRNNVDPDLDAFLSNGTQHSLVHFTLTKAFNDNYTKNNELIGQSFNRGEPELSKVIRSAFN